MHDFHPTVKPISCKLLKRHRKLTEMKTNTRGLKIKILFETRSAAGYRSSDDIQVVSWLHATIKTGIRQLNSFYATLL